MPHVEAMDADDDVDANDALDLLIDAPDLLMGDTHVLHASDDALQDTDARPYVEVDASQMLDVQIVTSHASNTVAASLEVNANTTSHAIDANTRPAKRFCASHARPPDKT